MTKEGDATSDFDLQQELRALGRTSQWLGDLCGVNRTTLWRWISLGRAPRYIQIIIKQQRTIRMLAEMDH